MNLGAILAMLMQTGLCAPVEFKGQDGSELTVLVCPMMKPAPVAGEPDALPPEKSAAPPRKA